MKTPGELLREAREERCLSRSDAAAMTRISRTMITHLEQDRFDEFTADVFVRGHLRNYARELGLDSSTVLQAYERQSSSGRPRHVSRSPSANSSATLRARQDSDDASSSGRSAEWTLPSLERDWLQKVGPTHMLAVALVLIGFVVFVGLLAGNRATAEDPATFPTDSQEEWELDQDVEETRWLLEQPVGPAPSDDENPGR